MPPDTIDIATLRALYSARRLTPMDVIDAIIARRSTYPDQAVWIAPVPDQQLRDAARQAMTRGPSLDQPLWGIPFAVSDIFDCTGFETTAACQEFAYSASADAAVIGRLKAAGAILVGKTNLDQFALGLSGTQSPYGVPRSVFHSDYIAGGPNSGAAVAVAAGLVSFAIGIDPTGAGGIPAAFNNLVNIKTTKGLVSLSGVVSAIRSQDCLSILSLTVGDGDLVRQLLQGMDPNDPFSRSAAPATLPHDGWLIGVLGKRERIFFNDREAAALYEGAIAVARELGGTPIEIDYGPFAEAASFADQGPWIAERLVTLDSFAKAHETALVANLREQFSAARGVTAIAAFDAQQRVRILAHAADAEWAKIDFMLLPSAPTLYTVAAMQADLLSLGRGLGRYGDFLNLFDCAAVSIPAGFRSDGLPFGVTLIGRAFNDQALAAVADQFHRHHPFGLGKSRDALLPADSKLPPHTDDTAMIEVFVVGSHLSGLALNHELTAKGGILIRRCRTAPSYQLYALAKSAPAKPGLIRSFDHHGSGIEGELWGLDAAGFGDFVAGIASPLAVAKVVLEDGRVVSGIVCEPHGLAGAKEITAYGGWRAFISAE